MIWVLVKRSFLGAAWVCISKPLFTPMHFIHGDKQAALPQEFALSHFNQCPLTYQTLNTLKLCDFYKARLTDLDNVLVAHFLCKSYKSTRVEFCNKPCLLEHDMSFFFLHLYSLTPSICVVQSYSGLKKSIWTCMNFIALDVLQSFSLNFEK